MKYENTKISFITDEKIRNKADLFRLKNWGDKIPVGIEEIVEINLKIKIIPVINFMEQCSVDAQMSSDFLSVYVDKKQYDNETSRFRFSLAHELGHFILHKNFYNNLKITSLEDVYSFIENVDGNEYSHLETQANKFANHFLVPREKLKLVRKQKIKEISKKHDISKIDDKTLDLYLAEYIAPKFGVSSGTAGIALSDLR